MKIYVKGKTNETAATLSTGQISGRFLLTYEDSSGNSYETATDFLTELKESQIQSLKVEEDQTRDQQLVVFHPCCRRPFPDLHHPASPGKPPPQKRASGRSQKGGFPMKKKKADSFTCFLAALCTLIFFLLIRLFLGIQAVYPVVEIPVT